MPSKSLICCNSRVSRRIADPILNNTSTRKVYSVRHSYPTCMLLNINWPHAVFSWLCHMCTIAPQPDPYSSENNGIVHRYSDVVLVFHHQRLNTRISHPTAKIDRKQTPPCANSLLLLITKYLVFAVLARQTQLNTSELVLE